MGITSALNIAAGGLISTQSGFDLVSRNIANADKPGYTRKTIIPVSSSLGGTNSNALTRHLNEFLLSQTRVQNSQVGRYEARSQVLDNASELFGRPGEWGLAEAFNDLTRSLQSLVDTPHDPVTQSVTVRAAKALTSEINSIGFGIQKLRKEAESRIADAVAKLNQHLEAIAQVNRTIGRMEGKTVEYNELLDNRDYHMSEVAKYINVTINTNDSDIAQVFLTDGRLIAGLDALPLGFEESAKIDALDRNHPDSDKRGVGTISVGRDPIGYGFDIGGSIGGFVEVRDVDLVELYDKLDAFASGLAKTLTDTKVNATPVVTPTNAGFNLDLASVKPGDTFQVQLETSGGEVEVHTFVRVDEAASLPLSASNASEYIGSASVTGVNFAGGYAAVANAIQTSLGGDITATASGSSLELRQPLVAAAARTRSLLHASATVSRHNNRGELHFPLFTDAARPAGFVDTLDGIRSEIGFAQRITVNQALEADHSLLVRYDNGIGDGDPSRPLHLLERLTSSARVYSSINPENPQGQTLYGTPSDYVANMVNAAGQAAETESVVLEQHQAVFAALESRRSAESGVNTDTELTLMISLQASFGANARVLSTAKEMMDLLLNI